MNVEGIQFSPDQVATTVPGTVHSKDGDFGIDKACEGRCQPPPLLGRQVRSGLVSVSCW